jgi:cobalt-zinc-cadmium efflux system protein
MLAEVFGGWWTGSLALLADAGHMLADVAALVLALMAVWFSARPATPGKTFGYYRLEILAALINGVGLVLIALYIFYESYQRWFTAPRVRSVPMMLVAAGGLAINLICARLLHRDRDQDLNVRGAWLHIMGDALGSAAAIVAGAVITFTGWNAADALFSALIGVLIVWILTTAGVTNVHDLHIWTITSGHDALSAHVIHAYSISTPNLLKELRTKLHDRFGVDHLTIQMETSDSEDEAFHFCQADTACFRSARE